MPDDPLRILVADDDPALVELLKESLESDGHTVLVAYDGLMAVESALRDKPDLLVMDVNMPGISGPDVLTRIRQSPETKALPVLFLTGESGATRLTRGDPLTASMEKPVEMDALSAKVLQLTRHIEPL